MRTVIVDRHNDRQYRWFSVAFSLTDLDNLRARPHPDMINLIPGSWINSCGHVTHKFCSESLYSSRLTVAMPEHIRWSVSLDNELFYADSIRIAECVHEVFDVGRFVLIVSVDVNNNISAISIGAA